MFDLITIGDCTVDTIVVIDEARVQCDLNKENCQLCLNYADKIPIRQTCQSIGGNAANIAVGCRRLGLKTSIVTELGDDINGFVIKNDLERAGVDTSHVKMLAGKETRYAVVLNYLGERTILSYHVKRNYSLPKLPQSEWVHYSSLGASFEKLQDRLEKHLSRHPGVKLAFNPGSFQMKYGMQKIKKIMPHTNLLIVNKEEAERIISLKKDIKTTIRTLHRLGVKTVVVTDGTNGSYVSDGQALYFMPAYPIKAIARTGAGDAYASGFISALVLRKTVKEAMQWGTANAGGVIQKMGAQNGLQTRTGLEKTISLYSKISPKIF